MRFLLTSAGIKNTSIHDALDDKNADQALEAALAEGYELSDDEVKAVADGEISFEEYKAAVVRFRECMAANGTPIEDFRYDEPTRQYEWTVWESYFDNPGAQACEREFQMTDMLWQYQIADELEEEQAPLREQRRVKIIECMRTKGADVESDLPYGQLMMRASREFPECVDAQFPT